MSEKPTFRQRIAGVIPNPSLRRSRHARHEAQSDLAETVVSELKASFLGDEAPKLDQTKLKPLDEELSGRIDASMGLPPTRYYIKTAKTGDQPRVEIVRVDPVPVFDPKPSSAAPKDEV